MCDQCKEQTARNYRPLNCHLTLRLSNIILQDILKATWYAMARQNIVIMLSTQELHNGLTFD